MLIWFLAWTDDFNIRLYLAFPELVTEISPTSLTGCRRMWYEWRSEKMTQVSHKLRKDPCHGYSSHFRNSQLREKVILCIFMLDLVLLLGFVGEWCSASSTFLPDAASSGSMTSLHRTAWIDTAYIYALCTATWSWKSVPASMSSRAACQCFRERYKVPL